MMDRETAQVVQNFAQKIKKKYSIKKFILFGSRARGDHLKGSDFDIIIVSDTFSRIPFMDRIPPLYQYWKAKQDLEVICYTPEEFLRKSKEHGIVRRAIKEGIEL